LAGRKADFGGRSDRGENLLVETESHEIFDVQDIAEEIFCVLDSIHAEDCWDRSDPFRYGYTSPHEAADQIVEEELLQFFDETERHHRSGLLEEEVTYGMGALSGVYRHERESKSEFRSWCEDIPEDYAHRLLDPWQKRNEGAAAITTMHEFICQSCPEWANEAERRKQVLGRPLQEQHRDKHATDRQRGYERRHRDSPMQRRFRQWHALLGKQAMRILDRNGRVVDQDADGERETAECHCVDGCRRENTALPAT
jgi:hypothetical protein